MNKPTIKSASIARISDKIGSLIGWLVKSNHSETNYLVRCKKVGSRCFWLCDCKAQEFGYNGFSKKRCCHVKAVCECEQARRETRTFPRFFVALAIIAEQQQAVIEAERQLAEERKREIAPLNGNSGFELLKRR